MKAIRYDRKDLVALRMTKVEAAELLRALEDAKTDVGRRGTGDVLELLRSLLKESK